MSQFTAIRAVSKTLQYVLEQQMRLDPQFAGETFQVVLDSPKTIREANDTALGMGVSIWLYRVVRNEFLLNRQPPRVSVDRVPHPGIPINLHYLVTPIHKDAETQQFILGKVLQVFNDSALLSAGLMRDALTDSADELRLSLETLTLEELTRVWASLMEPYQLSVSYLVHVVTIDSALEPIKVVPVESRGNT